MKFSFPHKERKMQWKGHCNSISYPPREQKLGNWESSEKSGAHELCLLGMKTDTIPSQTIVQYLAKLCKHLPFYSATLLLGKHFYDTTTIQILACTRLFNKALFVTKKYLKIIKGDWVNTLWDTHNLNEQLLYVIYIYIIV